MTLISRSTSVRLISKAKANYRLRSTPTINCTNCIHVREHGTADSTCTIVAGAVDHAHVCDYFDSAKRSAFTPWPTSTWPIAGSSVVHVDGRTGVCMAIDATGQARVDFGGKVEIVPFDELQLAPIKPGSGEFDPSKVQTFHAPPDRPGLAIRTSTNRNWSEWDAEHQNPTGHFAKTAKEAAAGHKWGQGWAAGSKKAAIAKGLSNKAQQAMSKSSKGKHVYKGVQPASVAKKTYTDAETAAYKAKKAAEAAAQAAHDAAYATSRRGNAGAYADRDMHGKEGEGPWGKRTWASRYGTVMFNGKGHVLLREPLNHFEGVHWSFAKGHADRQEHTSTAAIRETEEETGLTPNLVGHVPGGFGSPKGHPGSGSVNHYYLAEDSGNAFNPNMMNGETQKLVWATPQQADEMISRGTSVGRVFRDRQVLRSAVTAYEAARPNVTPSVPLKDLAPPPPPPPKPKPSSSPGGYVSPYANHEGTPAPAQGYKGMWYPGMPLPGQRSVAVSVSGMETRDWKSWDEEHPYVDTDGGKGSDSKPGASPKGHAWGEAGAPGWGHAWGAAGAAAEKAHEEAKGGPPKASTKKFSPAETAERKALEDRFSKEAVDINAHSKTGYMPGGTRHARFVKGYVNSRMDAHDRGMDQSHAHALKSAHTTQAQPMLPNPNQAERLGAAMGYKAHAIAWGDASDFHGGGDAEHVVSPPSTQPVLQQPSVVAKPPEEPHPNIAPTESASAADVNHAAIAQFPEQFEAAKKSALYQANHPQNKPVYVGHPNPELPMTAEAANNLATMHTEKAAAEKHPFYKATHLGHAAGFAEHAAANPTPEFSGEPAGTTWTHIDPLNKKQYTKKANGDIDIHMPGGSKFDNGVAKGKHAVETEETLAANSHTWVQHPPAAKAVEESVAKPVLEESKVSAEEVKPVTPPIGHLGDSTPKTEDDLKQMTHIPEGETFANGDKAPGLGFNGGKWYQANDGHAYLVKGQASDEHAMNEVAGALAYEHAGLKTPPVSLIKMNSGKLQTVTRYEPGLTPLGPTKPGNPIDENITPATQSEARKGFGMDAMMSHYDIFGRVSGHTGRNLFTDKEGNVVRLDLAGTGRFGGAGNKKGPGQWEPGDWKIVPNEKASFSTMLGNNGAMKDKAVVYGTDSANSAAHLAQPDIRGSLTHAANLNMDEYHQKMLDAGISKQFADEQVAVLKSRQDALKQKGLADDLSHAPEEKAPTIGKSVAAPPKVEAPQVLDEMGSKEPTAEEKEAFNAEHASLKEHPAYLKAKSEVEMNYGVGLHDAYHAASKAENYHAEAMNLHDNIEAKAKALGRADAHGEAALQNGEKISFPLGGKSASEEKHASPFVAAKDLKPGDQIKYHVKGDVHTVTSSAPGPNGYHHLETTVDGEHVTQNVHPDFEAEKVESAPEPPSSPPSGTFEDGHSTGLSTAKNMLNFGGHTPESVEAEADKIVPKNDFLKGLVVGLYEHAHDAHMAASSPGPEASPKVEESHIAPVPSNVPPEIGPGHEDDYLGGKAQGYDHGKFMLNEQGKEVKQLKALSSNKYYKQAKAAKNVGFHVDHAHNLGFAHGLNQAANEKTAALKGKPKAVVGVAATAATKSEDEVTSYVDVLGHAAQNPGPYAIGHQIQTNSLPGQSVSGAKTMLEGLHWNYKNGDYNKSETAGRIGATLDYINGTSKYAPGAKNAIGLNTKLVDVPHKTQFGEHTISNNPLFGSTHGESKMVTVTGPTGKAGSIHHTAQATLGDAIHAHDLQMAASVAATTSAPPKLTEGDAVDKAIQEGYNYTGEVAKVAEWAKTFPATNDLSSEIEGHKADMQLALDANNHNGAAYHSAKITGIQQGKAEQATEAAVAPKGAPAGTTWNHPIGSKYVKNADGSIEYIKPDGTVGHKHTAGTDAAFAEQTLDDMGELTKTVPGAGEKTVWTSKSGATWTKNPDGSMDFLGAHGTANHHDAGSSQAQKVKDQLDQSDWTKSAVPATTVPATGEKAVWSATNGTSWTKHPDGTMEYIDPAHPNLNTKYDAGSSIAKSVEADLENSMAHGSTWTKSAVPSSAPTEQPKSHVNVFGKTIPHDKAINILSDMKEAGGTGLVNHFLEAHGAGKTFLNDEWKKAASDKGLKTTTAFMEELDNQLNGSTVSAAPKPDVNVFGNAIAHDKATQILADMKANPPGEDDAVTDYTSKFGVSGVHWNDEWEHASEATAEDSTKVWMDELEKQLGASPPTIGASKAAPVKGAKSFTSVMAKNLKKGDQVLFYDGKHHTVIKNSMKASGLVHVVDEDGNHKQLGLLPEQKITKLAPGHAQFKSEIATDKAAGFTDQIVGTGDSQGIQSSASSGAGSSAGAKPGFLPKGVGAKAAFQPNTGALDKSSNGDTFHKNPGFYNAAYNTAYEEAKSGDVLDIAQIKTLAETFHATKPATLEHSVAKGTWDGAKQAHQDFTLLNKTEAEKKLDAEFLKKVSEVYGTNGKASLLVKEGGNKEVPPTIPHGKAPTHATSESNAAYDQAIAQGYDQAVAAYKSGRTPEEINATAQEYLDKAQAMGAPTFQAEIIEQAHLAGLAQGAGKAAVDLKADPTSHPHASSSKSIIGSEHKVHAQGVGAYDSYSASATGNPYLDHQSDDQLHLSGAEKSAVGEWKPYGYRFSHPNEPIIKAMDKLAKGENPGHSQSATNARLLLKMWADKATPNAQESIRKVSLSTGTDLYDYYTAVGTTIESPMASWTTDPTRWSGNVWLHAPEGTISFDIGKIKGYGSEVETLVSGEFLIESVKVEGGTTHVYLKQVAAYAK